MAHEEGSYVASAARWLVPLAIEAAAIAGLAAAGDPTRRPLLTLGLLAVASLALLAAVRGAAKRAPSARVMLAVAALLRLLLVPLPPALSTDVWRYLWDGRVVLQHENPYLHAPDPALAIARDELWDRVEHRDVPGVYPPLAMALFVLPAALPLDLGVVAWKLLVALADLGACALLLRLAAERGWPRHRVLWYAAQPLVLLEGAGMGHIEPIGVAGAIAAALLVARRQPLGAGVAAATAGLVKLVPFAAMPMWARQVGDLAGDASPSAAAAGASAGNARVRRSARTAAIAQFLLVAVGLAAVTLWPVVVAARGVPAGLSTYALRWEFGGPLHEPLWRLLAAADAPEAVKHALDLTKERTGMHAFWNRAYRWVYPQLLSRLLLVLPVLVIVVRSASSRRPAWRDPVRGGAALFGGLLVCSPTVYPWYLLWVLPWAALAGRAPWLWAALAAPLLYLPALFGVPAWPWVHLALWGPFFLLWAAERPWRARS